MDKFFKKLNESYARKQKLESRANTSLETRDDSKTPTIVLRIVLEKYSVFYGNSSYKWREKIGANAFDESIAKAVSGEVPMKSFIDHNKAISGLISSTKRDGVKLYKQDNEIVMEIPVEDDNDQAKRVYKQIQNGEITANSFIFIPQDTSRVKREVDGGGIEVDVTIEKGILKSIDPVDEAFYDFNIMEARKLESDTPDPIQVKKDAAKKEVEKRRAKIAEGESKMFEYIKKLLLERKLISKEEAESITPTQAFDKYEESRKAEIDKAIEAVSDAAEQEKLRAKAEAEIAATRTQFETNVDLRAKLAEARKKDADKVEDFASMQKSMFRGTYFNIDKKLVKEEIKTRLVKFRKAQYDALSETEATMFRDIIGNDADNGSQIIPVFTDKELIGETLYQIPEIDGVRVISFAGENTTKVPINIVPTGAAKRVAIGAESTAVDTNAVTAVLKPLLFSEHFTWNPRMQVHANTVAQDTLNVINRHRLGWRLEFATTLLTHIGVTFDSLKGADPNESTYTGGATIGAVHKTAAASTLTLSDIDAMEAGLTAKYGKLVLGLKFRYYMNSKTWTAIKALARAVGNDVWSVQVDAKNETINGIKVITNDAFVQNIVDGEHPIVLYSIDDVRVYGGNTVTRDSNEAEFKSRKVLRQVNTYGEVKLFDPHYRTRVLEILSA